MFRSNTPPPSTRKIIAVDKISNFIVVVFDDARECVISAETLYNVPSEVLSPSRQLHRIK